MLPLVEAHAPFVLLAWAVWLLLRYERTADQLLAFALRPPRWYVNAKRAVLQAWDPKQSFPLYAFVFRHARRTAALGFCSLGYALTLTAALTEDWNRLFFAAFAGALLLFELQLRRWTYNFGRYAERCQVTALKQPPMQSERLEL